MSVLSKGITILSDLQFKNNAFYCMYYMKTKDRLIILTVNKIIEAICLITTPQMR